MKLKTRTEITEQNTSKGVRTISTATNKQQQQHQHHPNNDTPNDGQEYTLREYSRKIFGFFFLKLILLQLILFSNILTLSVKLCNNTNVFFYTIFFSLIVLCKIIYVYSIPFRKKLLLILYEMKENVAEKKSIKWRLKKINYSDFHKIGRYKRNYNKLFFCFFFFPCFWVDFCFNWISPEGFSIYDFWKVENCLKINETFALWFKITRKKKLFIFNKTNKNIQIKPKTNGMRFWKRLRQINGHEIEKLTDFFSVRFFWIYPLCTFCHF